MPQSVSWTHTHRQQSSADRVVRRQLPDNKGFPAFEALGRPDLARLVVPFEHACVLGQLEPRRFAAREDVHVGRDRRGIVERTGAEQHRVARSRVVLVPQRGPAFLAAEDIVRFAAAAGWDGKRHGRLTIQLDELAFDPQIDRERGAADLLTIAAMAGMDNHRRVGQPVTHRTARATALKAHLPLPLEDQPRPDHPGLPQRRLRFQLQHNRQPPGRRQSDGFRRRNFEHPPSGWHRPVAQG